MRTNQRGLSTILIIIIVVAIIALLGAGYYYWDSNKNDTPESTSQSTSGEDATGEESLLSKINATAPYRIVVTSVDDADETKNSVIKIDYKSEFEWKMTAKTDDGETEMMVVGDYTYSKNGDQWMRFPFNPTTSEGVSAVGSYNISEDKLQQYNDVANRVQQADEACETGQCAVYKSTISDDGTVAEATIYVDKNTNKLVKVVSKNGSTTSTLSYNYDIDLTIIPPTDFQDVNIPTN